MLLMIEKGIRGGICNIVHQYTKANYRYMKDYHKNKDLSYRQYWDINNLYGWVMSLKFPVNNFEWIKETPQFDEDFIKNCNKESDEGSFLEVDVQNPEKLYEFHNDLSFLPEKKKLKKFEKLVDNLHNKSDYVIHIKI